MPPAVTKIWVRHSCWEAGNDERRSQRSDSRLKFFQVFRCGTAPALHYGEAQSAESRKALINKMKIALKEMRESLICLKIIERRDA